jgi:hypothetical protein
MKIAYTVCSLNRLGQIIVLAKSLLQHNPEYRFIAGLADEVNNRIDVKSFPFIEFIPLSQLRLPQLDKLDKQYDIFELSCALKAFYGSYLFENYNPEILLYFDTDICVYNNFSIIERALDNHPVLLSPHFITPIPNDGKFPLERDVLNAGLYNGGFLGLKNSMKTKQFLSWWQQRLSDQGFNNVCEGMMVDQLWLNLVPLYFSDTGILTNEGCNLAYWNMHERKLVKKDGEYFANDQPLVFFHFSGFRIDKPHLLSTHQNRYKLSENEVLKSIVKNYSDLLTANHFESYLSIPSVYGKKKPVKHHSVPKKILMRALAIVGYKLEKIRKM